MNRIHRHVRCSVRGSSTATALSLAALMLALLPAHAMLAQATATTPTTATSARTSATQTTEHATSRSGLPPSGWVGVSVIQKGHGSAGSATLEYPVVASVEPGSPAQSAGLVAGDTIISYNSVDANTDPAAVERFLKPGRELVVKIRRNGVRSLRLTVARRSSQDSYRSAVTVSSDASVGLPLLTPMAGGPIAYAAAVAPGRAAPFAGAYFARLNAGLARALSVKDEGVLVVDVGPGSAAMRAGLQAGDVITRADSLAVVSPLEIATAMRFAAARSITLGVLRQGKQHEISIDW